MASSNRGPWPEPTLGREHPETWKEIKGKHIPGLKVTDLPMWIVVDYNSPQTGRPSQQTLPLLDFIKDFESAGQAKDAIERRVRTEWDPTFQLPIGWSIQQWVTNAGVAWHLDPMEIDNPRVYDIQGKERPDLKTAEWLVAEVRHAFVEQLGYRWQSIPGDSSTTPFNHRRSRTIEFLDFHREQGGNARAFQEFVATIASNPELLPPPPAPSSSSFMALGGSQIPITDPEGLGLLLREWLSRKKPSKLAATAKSMPTTPLLAAKFEAVPGSLGRWMSLLKSEGLVDENGHIAIANRAKGKGKLIAAWTAAVEVFPLAAFPQDTELIKALVDHFPGLKLDRLDKVRKRKGFTDKVEIYKELLQDD